MAPGTHTCTALSIVARDSYAAGFYTGLRQLADLAWPGQCGGLGQEVSGKRELKQDICNSASRSFADVCQLTGRREREARVTSEQKAGSNVTKCGTAASVQGLRLGINRGVGRFPEFIFSVLTLIHCFAPFPLKHCIPPDMPTFQNPFWCLFYVCFLGSFSKILLRQCNTAHPCVRAAPFWKMENKS